MFIKVALFILFSSSSSGASSCLPSVEDLCRRQTEGVDSHVDQVKRRLNELKWNERLKNEFRANLALEESALMFGIHPRGPLGNQWKFYYKTISSYLESLAGSSDFLLREQTMHTHFDKIKELFLEVIQESLEFDGATRAAMKNYVKLTTILSAREYLAQDNNPFRALEVVETCGPGARNWNASFGPIGVTSNGQILVCPSLLLEDSPQAWTQAFAHELGHAVDVFRFETEYFRPWPELHALTESPNEVIADLWSQRVLVKYFQKGFGGRRSDQTRANLNLTLVPLCDAPGIQTHQTGRERIGKYLLNPASWSAQGVDKLFCSMSN